MVVYITYLICSELSINIIYFVNYVFPLKILAFLFLVLIMYVIIIYFLKPINTLGKAIKSIIIISAGLSLMALDLPSFIVNCEPENFLCFL